MAVKSKRMKKFRIKGCGSARIGNLALEGDSWKTVLYEPADMTEKKLREKYSEVKDVEELESS